MPDKKSNGFRAMVLVLVAVIGLTATAVVFASSSRYTAQEAAKRVEDHEARLRLLETNIMLMQSDVRAIRLLIEMKSKEGASP